MDQTIEMKIFSKVNIVTQFAWNLEIGFMLFYQSAIKENLIIYYCKNSTFDIAVTN